VFESIAQGGAFALIDRLVNDPISLVEFLFFWEAADLALAGRFV
jgi:hypothetical protein